LKVVILAGGLGTRLSEETDLKPKPMVEIGGYPIIWHIMKIYSYYGFNDFIICLGYKGNTIKRYFSDLYLQSSDYTINTKGGKLTVHKDTSPDWDVTMIDTGSYTLTGGRLLRIKDYLTEDTFMMTYGDGVSNVNLIELLTFHRKHGRAATLTAVNPPARFGVIRMKNNGQITSFHEKPDDNATWINGGFFVLNKEIFHYIGKDDPYFEDYPLRDIAKDGELFAYRHYGFWHPMDTMSDKRRLEELWAKGKAEWKIWKD
jgi:glucose-1-phosphate cytidylyltransferase